MHSLFAMELRRARHTNGSFGKNWTSTLISQADLASLAYLCTPETYGHQQILCRITEEGKMELWDSFSTYTFGSSINSLVQLDFSCLPSLVLIFRLFPCQSTVAVFHEHSKFSYFVASQPVIKEQTEVASGCQVGEEKFQSANILLVPRQCRDGHIITNSFKRAKDREKGSNSTM